jgi:hypothetical protein
VSFQSNGQALKDADLSVTDAGRSVLAEDKDWIELGGSDRWLGGVHLEGANAKWRWDAANSAVMEARAS